MEELIAIVQPLDGNSTKEEVQEMVRQADIDGNGSIDFEEFLSIMRMQMKVRNRNLELLTPRSLKFERKEKMG